ncbi:MAG: putative Ceramide glucosyltransferase [Limisphaerales bacterium]|nr:MAG: putative Ceramide glucosyltransferase [Limisphaerales bacterium]KAG0509227.1 MAG: putative Ceramide glucosyltransferase [Limisphaerales bacterium]TXT52234.1 MAG: putative Ceramide glucosyltransferase [Limisphaerales bacterium]
MLLHLILAALALLSLAITLWQWLAARRFPLHQRATDTSFAPGVTLLKPLKGLDPETRGCLESWFKQDYRGPVQLLFGVADEKDPACELVRKLIAEHPQASAQLVLCPEQLGPNAKVSTLVHLERLAQHDHLIVSDADTRVPPDFLAQVVQPLRDPQAGLVNCFYALTNPTTLAMQWEAVAVNADFWSQVLQSRTLKPLDFALGAVMATRRQQLNEVGGFRALVDYLADDYQLGNQIAKRGYRIELCPVVVECREREQGWREVWAHQLRWARTIRVCQPVPYFFSILSNATWWPTLATIAAFVHVSSRSDKGLLGGDFTPIELLLFGHNCFLFMLGWVIRLSSAFECDGRLLIRRLEATSILLENAFRIRSSSEMNRNHAISGLEGARVFLPLLKDLLQVPIWALAFLGNTVVWRGQRLRVLPGGKLVPVAPKQP